MAPVTNEFSTSTGTPFPQLTESSSSNTKQFSADDGRTQGSPFDQIELFCRCLEKNKQLEEDVKDLQSELKITHNFYENSSALAKTSKKAITALMIVPILQLVACTIVVYYLGIQDNLPSLLTWILGGVSLLSILEVGFTMIKYTSLESKVEEIEKRLDRLDKE